MPETCLVLTRKQVREKKKKKKKEDWIVRHESISLSSV